MLVNLDKPESIHEEMRTAAEFVIDLMEYCHVQSVSDGQFDEKSFIRRKRYKKYKDCCLLKHPKAMRNRMKRLFSVISGDEMASLIDFLRCDLDFVKHHESDIFQFSGYLGLL
ncbi:hypothetical protein J2Z22_000660 [Paenibacillus forsythiae]|uniref:Uncharacterized protein n=1 Tax=Paenibacillus forsythiae TaxID=365616 RepID=A0ABU3H517_9BACL|nr:hypothetical protein [Paenibacillus forsythiae]MDT3425147.1 hypothetical protein [Paenibacillus forsythiae]